MADIAALEKHACAACGAQAVWNPSKQLLECPFCGTSTPFTVDPASGALVENDLARALRELPDEARGWLTEKRTVQCQSCKAVSVFDPERVGQNCNFCGSPALVDYHEIKAPIRPQGVLPFKVSEPQVREQIRQWYASKWLAPGKLKQRALVDRVRGVYIPYWTFDAHAVCPWIAEAGHYYYTSETYRDSKGHTRTRQVRHVRWEPASGEVRHFFDDEPVPGTQGVSHDLLKEVEPFATVELVPYDTAFLSGFVVEHYQIVLLQAAENSQASMSRQLFEMAASEIPGDTYQNLEIKPVFSGQTFKHILVPVWLLSYLYGTKSYQVVVNGYSGRMAGQYPRSAWKIALLVLLAIVAFLIVMMMSAEG
ncbi:MAG: zinc ribbon domain-containing protein [Acidobacteriota bacterium]|nr:zinc ribbon domain-containing protein [Acidobacteriota bacterium]